MVIEMNLKKQIEFYLDHFDMTASQLARKAFLPKQTVHNWLNGQKPRDMNQVKKVAEVLGVSLDNLLFGEGKDSSRVSKNMLGVLLSEEWIGGKFEIKIRRLKE